VTKGPNASRRKLPFLRPENEKISVWSLVGKFVGQDLTKISLPVILSEPLSTLQKNCECINAEEERLAEAAAIDDPL